MNTRKKYERDKAMGMAASQARFLGLTARKNNVEYEGQQINQQRTTLGNQSANYYNDLLGMAVPVPPSVQDYTKTVYTFQDGNLNNNITALIAQSNGMYKVSYVSQWQNDFTPVGNGAAVIFKDTTNPDYDLFKVGNQTLRELGTTYDAYGPEKIANGTKIQSGPLLDGVPLEDILFSGKDSSSNPYDSLKLAKNSDGEYKLTDIKSGTEFDLDDITIDGKYELFGTPYDIKFYQKAPNTDLSMQFNNSGTWTAISAKLAWSTSVFEINNARNTTKMTEPVAHDIANDKYLSTLTPAQLTKTLEQEQEFLAMLNKKYGTTGDKWYVRYVENTTSGVYEPIFYNEKIVVAAQYDDNQTGVSQSNIPCYKMGSATETEEVKGVDARLEKDATGRYINITLMPQPGVELTYSLTTSTITDQDAFNDAMNQYEFDKQKYDQYIQEINAKIEIVQAEDRNLELRLKQLDTEQDAISTEMDAVQKVIEKNVESSFKTFG